MYLFTPQGHTKADYRNHFGVFFFIIVIINIVAIGYGVQFRAIGYANEQPICIADRVSDRRELSPRCNEQTDTGGELKS